jgi:hypothetical protein
VGRQAANGRYMTHTFGGGCQEQVIERSYTNINHHWRNCQSERANSIIMRENSNYSEIPADSSFVGDFITNQQFVCIRGRKIYYKLIFIEC